jgi:hypothetical protein
MFQRTDPAACWDAVHQTEEADGLAAALGNGLEPLVSRRLEHHTPGGAVQPFTHLGLRRP